jgi:hypothetical protein
VRIRTWPVVKKRGGSGGGQKYRKIIIYLIKWSPNRRRRKTGIFSLANTAGAGGCQRKKNEKEAGGATATGHRRRPHAQTYTPTRADTRASPARRRTSHLARRCLLLAVIEWLPVVVASLLLLGVDEAVSLASREVSRHCSSAARGTCVTRARVSVWRVRRKERGIVNGRSSRSTPFCADQELRALRQLASAISSNAEKGFFE